MQETEDQFMFEESNIMFSNDTHNIFLQPLDNFLGG